MHHMFKKITVGPRSLFLPFAFYNFGDGSPSAKRADIRTIVDTKGEDGHKPVIVFFIEAYDRHDEINDFCNATGWKPYLHNDGKGAGAVAAIVHPSYTKYVTLFKWYPAVETTDVGDPGVGPSVVGAKSILHIRMGRGFGRTHFFVTHLIPSIDRTSLSNYKKRIAHAKKHLAVLKRVTKRRIGQSWIVMDANTEWHNQILNGIRNNGFVNVRTVEPTHGNRRIDLVLYRWNPPFSLRKLKRLMPKKLRPVQVKAVANVVRGLSSDHKAVLVSTRE